MKKELWLDKLIKEFKDDVEFVLERTILDFTESVCEQMEKKNISRTELAKRLNKSRSFVTRVLNGQPNLTIKTMVEIAHALESELCGIKLRTKVSSRLAILPPRDTEDKETVIPKQEEQPTRASDATIIFPTDIIRSVAAN